MRCNMGTREKIFRTILGTIIIVMSVWFRSWWWPLGVILLITADLGWCPVNSVLGINTYRSRHQLRFLKIN